MMHKTCIVITTIQSSDSVVLNNIAFGAKKANYGLIIAGDRKSPVDFDLGYGDYLDIDKQNHSTFQLAKSLPENTYARKNIAYLLAFKKGYSAILETDDDNDPMPSFWDKRESEVKGRKFKQKGWLNVYSFFSDDKIWPRGFLLSEINESKKAHSEQVMAFCPIQQGLVNGDPDVDAIYRLINKGDFFFNKEIDVILNEQLICPFNSQNTLWFKFAYPLMYLPSYCSFRMTDIWRSFIAQRILWTCDANVAFYNATVTQFRNQHDLMNDFSKELQGYLRNQEFVEILNSTELKKGKENMVENLHKCYQVLITEGFFENKEIFLLEEWIKDFHRIESIV